MGTISKCILSFIAGCLVACALFWFLLGRQLNQAVVISTDVCKALAEQRDACLTKFNRSTFLYERNLIGTGARVDDSG